MTREEVDAKIAASEARTDVKFAALMAKIDVLIARMDQFDIELRQLRTDMANLRKTVVITGISSVLAVIFGVAGFNATLLNNMTASFEGGKNAGQWQSETTRKLDENTQRLAETNQKLDKLIEAHESRLNQIEADLKKIKPAPGSGRK